MRMPISWLSTVCNLDWPMRIRIQTSRTFRSKKHRIPAITFSCLQHLFTWFVLISTKQNMANLPSFLQRTFCRIVYPVPNHLNSFFQVICYRYPYFFDNKTQLIIRCEKRKLFFIPQKLKNSPAGWRSAPALNPNMRRGLGVLLVG